MSVYDQYKVPAAGGGLYLRLEDGDAIKVRLYSEPYIFQNDYQGNISTKYAWVVYNYAAENGQVLQLPVTGYRSLAAIAADPEWGDPTGFDVTVKREGGGKDTKYHVTPSPNKAPLTPEQLQTVKKLDLTAAIKGAIPLAQVVAGKSVPEPAKTPDVVITELPDDLDANEIPF